MCIYTYIQDISVDTDININSEGLYAYTNIVKWSSEFLHQ